MADAEQQTESVQQPGQQPFQPGQQQSQPGQQPYQPGQQPYQPGQQPYQPGQPPYQPGQQPYQSGQQPYQPGQQPYQPGQQPYQPGQPPYQPGQQPYQSGQQPYQPGQQPYQPGQQPIHSGPDEQSGRRLNMQYVVSAPGVLKILQFLFLLVAFSSGLSCCTGFFIWATIIAWLNVIIVFVLFAGNFIEMEVKWLTKLMINSLVWLAILLIAYSILIASGNALWRQGYTLPTTFYVSLVFGILACIMFFWDGCNYYGLKKEGLDEVNHES